MRTALNSVRALLVAISWAAVVAVGLAVIISVFNGDAVSWRLDLALAILVALLLWTSTGKKP